MYSKKIEMDKFYTKSKIAELCISKINIEEYDLIIEPSAGNGAFLNILIDNKKESTDVIGIDISPENENILKKDWFLFNIDKKYNKVLIIGNPPFGKRNKLSKKFITHSASFDNVKTIAFILPNVFKKHTLQKVIPKDFRIKEIIELPKNSFMIENKEYHVPCSFFIFDKSLGKCLRFDESKYTETPDWNFSNKEDYDFFILGASPKTILKTPNKNNRGYYIKIKNNKNLNNIIKKFESIKWNGNSSVSGGVSWFTKPEIVKIYLDN